MRASNIALIVFSIILVSLSGCGPKVSISPRSIQKLRTVLVIPPSYDVPVSRERIDFINDAFAKKLSTHGFNVISGTTARAFCRERNCDNLALLATQSDSDAIAKLDVTSTNSANVLAGYFQSISGNGSFFGRDGKEIARVEYTQTERGGLLFNSGQVLQGIQSTVDNFGDSSFNNLADKFLETIVSKLPMPSGTLEVLDLQSGKSSLTALGSGRYLACIESQNANSASLRNGKFIVPLRAAGVGKFCGGFLLDANQPNLTNSQWGFHLFGRYGESKSVPIEPFPNLECDTQQAVKKHSEKVVLSTNSTECSNYNFLVFEAKQLEGPYTLKGKLQKPGNSLSISDKEALAIVVVVVSDKLGSSKTLILK